MGLYSYKGKIISETSHNIGYLPQKYGMFKEWTVKDVLAYFGILKNIPSQTLNEVIAESLELVNMSEALHHKVKTLSGGMIRRIGIAQAILDNPPILIVDEPTAGLDPEERMRFKLLISKLRKDRVIIISTHITDDVDALCDHVIVLANGQIKGNFTLLEMKEKAHNKVYILAEEDAVESKGEIIKTFIEDDKKYVRVLTSEKLDFKPAEPSIEDGYLCIIKNI